MPSNCKHGVRNDWRDNFHQLLLNSSVQWSAGCYPLNCSSGQQVQSTTRKIPGHEKPNVDRMTQERQRRAFALAVRPADAVAVASSRPPFLVGDNIARQKNAFSFGNQERHIGTANF